MSEDGEEYLDMNYPMKTHEEILTRIEEIKAYEQWVKNGTPSEHSQPTMDDLVELPLVEEEFPEWECLDGDNEAQETPSLLETKGDASSALKRQRSTSPVKSSVFHLRFDEEGALINVDLRAPRESLTGNNKKNTLLQRLRREKQAEDDETEEAPAKTSKVKAGLRKVRNLKKLIPGRKKEPEVAEANPEEDEEEDEEDEDW